MFGRFLFDSRQSMSSSQGPSGAEVESAAELDLKWHTRLGAVESSLILNRSVQNAFTVSDGLTNQQTWASDWQAESKSFQVAVEWPKFSFQSLLNSTVTTETSMNTVTSDTVTTDTGDGLTTVSEPAASFSAKSLTVGLDLGLGVMTYSAQSISWEGQPNSQFEQRHFVLETPFSSMEITRSSETIQTGELGLTSFQSSTRSLSVDWSAGTLGSTRIESESLEVLGSPAGVSLDFDSRQSMGFNGAKMSLIESRVELGFGASSLGGMQTQESVLNFASMKNLQTLTIPPASVEATSMLA